MFQSFDLSTMPRLWGAEVTERTHEAPAVTRKEALVAFARVAPWLNLQEDDVLLVCVLASLAGSAWRKKRRPQFESISLADIQKRTGFDPVVLDRRLNGLERAGILNKARDGRFGEGHVLVDMSPLANRTAQFEWMAEAEAVGIARSTDRDIGFSCLAGCGFFDEFDFSGGSGAQPSFNHRLRSLFELGKSKRVRLSRMVNTFFGFWSGTSKVRAESVLIETGSEQPFAAFDFPEHDKVEASSLDTILRALEADVKACVEPRVPEEQPYGDCHFITPEMEAEFEDVSNYMERMILGASDERDGANRLSGESELRAPVRRFLRRPPSALATVGRSKPSFKPSSNFGKSGRIDKLVLDPKWRMSRILTLAIRDMEIQLRLQ